MKETKFKQTEIGLIPCDWEVKKLGEIFTIKHGYGFKGSFFSNENNNLIVLTPGNFRIEGGFQKTHSPIFYKGVYPNEFKLHPNDLIVTMTDLSKNSDTLGNALIIPDDGVQYLHNQRLGLIQLLNDLYEKKFIFWNLCTKKYHHNVVSSAAGSTVKHTSPSRICSIKLPFPATIEEQKRIAQALSDVDAVISTTEKLIAKKKALKQGAMQTLLSGKMRIQNGKWIKTTHFKQTELGPIPQEWEVKSFGELFEILPNNTLSRAELNEGQGSYKNVHYGDVLVKFQEWIDCSKTALPFINPDAKFNHTTLQDGDVIIADTAEDETVGKSTEIFNAHNLRIVSGLHTIPIRPKTMFASKWLGYFINSVCWHDQILPFITGTKVSAISKAAVAQTKFFYPAKMDEQTAIATILSDMDSEIAALGTKLAKYRQLKTGMMQQLLTGKIRLV